MRTLFLLLLFALTPEASAIVVTTLADTHTNDGACSLREAIEAANWDRDVHGLSMHERGQECTPGNGPDVITFAVTGTIRLTSSLPEVRSPVEINGPESGEIEIDGSGLYGLIHVYPIREDRFSSPPLYAFRRLLLRRGFAENGGCVRVEDPFAIEMVSIALLLEDLDMTGCTATSSGGGLYVEMTEFGSRIDITVQRCSLTDNFARWGGGLKIGQGIHLGLFDSLVAGNIATEIGGGIRVSSGGPTPEAAILTMTRSTVSGNAALESGGGLYLWGPETYAYVTHSTIVGNEAGAAGGGVAFSDQVTQTSILTLANTVLAGNVSGTGTDDIDLQVGSVIDRGHVVLGVNTGVEAVFPANGTGSSRAGTPEAPLDPGLTALADHGGPLFTHLPLLSSVLVDTGSCPGELTDGRGMGPSNPPRRTVDLPAPNVSDGCDVGAVEREFSAEGMAGTLQRVPWEQPDATREARSSTPLRAAVPPEAGVSGERRRVPEARRGEASGRIEGRRRRLPSTGDTPRRGTSGTPRGSATPRSPASGTKAPGRGAAPRGGSVQNPTPVQRGESPGGTPQLPRRDN